MSFQALNASFCILALSPVTAWAQIAQMSHSLSWVEVYAGTDDPVSVPDGILQPGEAARLSVTLSFTPVGTPVVYQSPPPGGVAPVAGLEGTVFDIAANNALGGTWSFVGVSPGFEGGLISVGASGSARQCMVGQTPASGAFPIPDNPLQNVWHAVWNPPSYSERQVAFQAQAPNGGGSPSNLWVYVGLNPNGIPVFASANASASYSGVQISVVPSPASMASLLCCAVAVMTTRRRRPV